MRRTLPLLMLASALFVTTAACAQGQQSPRTERRAVVEKLRENLYVATTGGPTRTNITFFITENHGVVMFETGDPGWGAAWLEAAKSITSKPLTTLVVSHTHDDHTGSMPEIRQSLVRVSHANVLASLKQSRCAALSGCRLFTGADARLLPDRTYTGRLTLFEGRDRIELYNFGASHTNGDTIAVIPALGVVIMGDMMAWRGIPRVYVDDGGRATGFASALSQVTSMKGIDTVITGHSAVMGWADLLEFRDYVSDYSAYVTAMHAAGKTIDEVIAGLSQRLSKYQPCPPSLTDAAELQPDPGCRYRTDQARRNAIIMYDELEGRTSTYGSERPTIRFMSTDAIIDPLQAVQPHAENATARDIQMIWGSARGDLREAILADKPFDVALLLPEVNAELLRAGKVMPQTYAIAQIKTAVGQRGNAPLVDVSTPAALKAAVLGAKALRWYKTGISLATVEKMLDGLDIRAPAIAKYRLHSDIELAPGEYELDFYPLSEILVRRDLRNAGLVPDELQVPGIMSAAISTRTQDLAGAHALIEFLRSPTVEPALRASGFTR